MTRRIVSEPPWISESEREQRWIFSRGSDVAVFGGSAALALALLGVGHLVGLTRGPLPAWTWLLAVVLVDVAHVWATLFRVYLDPTEVRRRPLLYLGAPLLAYGTGVLFHAKSPRLFWSALAYLAAFHFVRQQYGWVAMYRRRNGEHGGLDAWLDALAIYNATVYPLLFWHAHLPRSFDWLIAGDFVGGLPSGAIDALHPVHLAIMVVWAARQTYCWAARRRVSAGKVLVVVSTWLCWYVGIVATDSDYAFTLTNVLIHGVPYAALVWRYARNRYRERPASLGEAPREPTAAEWLVSKGPLAFLAVIAVCAFFEEALWDLLVWHERPWLFGDADITLPGALATFVVPFLAIPQATHYVLDAFVWRAGASNPELLRDLGFVRAPADTLLSSQCDAGPMSGFS